MSHRRGGMQKEAAVEEETVPFGQSMDQPTSVPTMERAEEEAPVVAPANGQKAPGSLSLDDRYETEAQALSIKQWREGPFAASMTPTTWAQGKWKNDCREECAKLDSDDDGCPCVCCSDIVCGMVGAARVGNMAVLKQSTEWVEEEEEDEETGETRVRRFTRPRLDVVVGPYWPMLCLVTYPLIFGVSLATLIKAIPGKHPLIIGGWAVLTVGLIVALALTAFRDPGILPRYERPPPHGESTWRWSDRALSYRPPGSFFDVDTGVVVEGFDHTCPWTGTAIGKRNMAAFQCFVGLVFICLIIDIILLTGGIRP